LPNEQAAHVIGLFPELLGIGGVQEASRLTAAAMVALAPIRNWKLDLLSLNDSPGPHKLGVGGQSIDFRGFGRSKGRFALAAMLGALSSPRGARQVAVATHPNLAPVTRWMRWGSSRMRRVVMSHGIEVWEPLPGARRSALQS
jgi:phosphatidyl-myo-inositol dimannoside synthase